MAHFRFVITENAFGDVPQLYQAVRPFLDGLFWNDVRNADTCAWLVAGCLRSQHCSLPDWVSGRRSKARYAQSRERQGRRFLQNPRIDPISVNGPLVAAALQDWGEHRLVLALDTSMLFNQFCLIRVAVVFRGRTLPLYQEVIQHGSAQVSTEQLLPLLAQVKGMLDFLKIRDVRLLADRGFCDVTLMNWLRVCGFLARTAPMRTLGRWHFRIRVKSNLILADPKGQRPGPCWGSALAKKRLCQLNEIKLSPRETRCFHQVTITGQRFGPVHVALGRPTQKTEQWQVVSSEPTTINTFAEYGERFRIEEGFLDDKSGLFDLEASGLRDTVSLNRLVLILALATLFLVSKGIETVAGERRRMVDPHWERGLSYLKIGLRAMQWALSRGQAVFTRLTSPGNPDPEPLGKRRPRRPDPLTTLELGWTLVFRPPS